MNFCGLGCALLVCWLDLFQLLNGCADCKAVQVTRGTHGELGPVLSPDGRWLAFEYFTPTRMNDPEIWIMPRDGSFSDAKPILNGEDEEYGEISWSPDSEWLSFVGEPRIQSGALSCQIYKVKVATRQVVQLTHLPEHTCPGAGTSWSHDSRIAFEMDGDIYTVAESGGPVSILLDVQAALRGVGPYFPTWSPDGARLAFVGRQPHGHDLYVADLRGKVISKVFSGVGDDGPSWFDSERILCSRLDGEAKSSIWLVTISVGQAVRLTQGYYDGPAAADPTGTYLYFCRHSSDFSSNDPSLVKNFHIWKCKLALQRSGLM